jgi:hypothetical protein
VRSWVMEQVFSISRRLRYERTNGRTDERMNGKRGEERDAGWIRSRFWLARRKKRVEKRTYSNPPHPAKRLRNHTTTNKRNKKKSKTPTQSNSISNLHVLLSVRTSTERRRSGPSLGARRINRASGRFPTRYSRCSRDVMIRSLVLDKLLSDHVACSEEGL